MPRTTMRMMPSDGGAVDDGAGVVNPPSSDATPTGGQGGFADTIPTEFRDKPYIQDLLKSEDPVTALFKSYDGLQSKLGQRPAGIPTDDAPEEEWQKFIEAARPKSPDAYIIEPLSLGEDKKDLAELYNSYNTPERIKPVLDLAHKWGLPKKPFEGFAKEYQALTAETLTNQVEAQKALDAEFGKVFEVFGGDKEKAIAAGRSLIEKHVPENMRPFMDGLPNETLALIAAMGLSLQKESAPDTLRTPDATTGTSEKDLDVELSQLMKKAHSLDKFSSEYRQVSDKIRETSERLAKMRSR